MFGFTFGKADRVRDSFVDYCRHYMIRSLIGANGSGKTAMGVRLVIPSLEAGRTVLSTVRILDYRKPRPCDDPECPGQYVGGQLVPCDKSDPGRHLAAHPNYVRWWNWQQLLDAHHTDAFADEVTASFSSRSWQSVPDEVVLMANQFRKPDVTLTWTAPAWSRSDSVIREVTQLVLFCKGSGMVPNEDGSRVIGNNTRFVAAAADIRDEDADIDVDKLIPVRKTRWKGPGSLVFDAYDTNEAVSLVASPKAGPCLSCGLPKRREYCSCGDHGVGSGSGRPAAAGRQRSAEGGADGTTGTLAQVHALAPRRALT